MTNAAIYIRKSREDKDKPSQRLNVQREQLPAYAASKGWDISIYDDGHASAAQGKTESLKERARLETDIRGGKINVILCIELSRLSRDDTMQDYVAWLTLCADHRVKLSTMSRILDPSQHSDWMLLLMEGGFSSVEMKVLQARMKEGRDEAYRAGKFLGGGCPPPYIYDKAQGRPVIDINLLIQAKRVWQLAETMSARKLALTLNMPMISTRRMLADDRLLFCQALRADPSGGKPIKCDWKPCLTPKQADRIRAGRRIGYKGPRRPYGGLLSNLSIMYCGYCKSTWRGWKGQTRVDGTWTNYYGCQGKAHKGKCPKSKMVEQTIIDSRLTINLLGILDKIPELKTVWEKSAGNDTSINRLEQITREQISFETKKQRLAIAISEGVIEFADAKQQMNAIKTTLEALKKEKCTIITTPTEEPPWEALAEVRDMFRTASQEEQREIIATAIKQIKVYSTYLLIEYRFPVSENGGTSTRIHLPLQIARD